MNAFCIKGLSPHDNTARCGFSKELSKLTLPLLSPPFLLRTGETYSRTATEGHLPIAATFLERPCFLVLTSHLFAQILQLIASL